MSRSSAFASILALAVLFPVAAEESEWVIAAEKFTAVDIPAVYGNFPSVVPQLILSRLSSISSRVVLPEEQLRRELAALSAARIALVKERSDLVLSRDRVLLSADSDLVKRNNRVKIDKNIKAKEKDIAALDLKTGKILDAAPSGAGTVSKIKLWKSAKDLYVRGSGISLVKSLSNDKISGLVTGSVQDLAGYLLVTARLDTGSGGIQGMSVSEAAPYDEIEQLVSRLTARLLPEIANRAPVSLTLDVAPGNARVFIDNRLVPDFSLPVTIFSGTHTVTVSAPGFLPASKTADFSGADAFAVTIDLVPLARTGVTFDTGTLPASLYTGTSSWGELPATVDIPALKTIGETVSSEGSTWFVYDPAAQASGDAIPTLILEPDRVATAKRIERQRKTLYWSLGALYLSLPVSLLSYGTNMNKYLAWENGDLENTDEVVRDIETWSRISQISSGVSVALGVNVAFQLVRYILAAEQAIPRSPEAPKN